MACRILSSLTRDQTNALGSETQSLNHWTAREVLLPGFKATFLCPRCAINITYSLSHFFFNFFIDFMDFKILFWLNSV